MESILHPLKLKALATEWILEDTSGLDYSSASFLSKTSEENIKYAANITVKENCVLCGFPFCEAVFEQLDCRVKWLLEEGQEAVSGTRVGSAMGSVRNLLLAERIVLNVLSRASGTATISRRVKNSLKENGWSGAVAGTRKTTPGFRLVEKYSMLVGGICSHRYSLSDMVMVKDNHIKIAGSVKDALARMKPLNIYHQKVEVECSSLEEAIEAASHGCDIVMFDNFEAEDLRTSAARLKALFPNILIEASGSITERNILKYATEKVDLISSSMFVQGYKTIDFSMKIDLIS